MRGWFAQDSSGQHLRWPRSSSNGEVFVTDQGSHLPHGSADMEKEMDRERNDGGPAFPQHGYESQDEKHWDSSDCGGAGLTLRDYFAAKALPAVIAAYANDTMRGMKIPDYFAAKAYEVADAMLAARTA